MSSSATRSQLSDDPSVVFYGKDGSDGVQGNGGKLQSGVNPGNVLSKLLDSAMAKAAKETTPELETAETKQWSIQTSDGSKDKQYVYSIKDLLTLKNAADKTIVRHLPDKGFWRAKVKFGANASSSRESKQSRKTIANSRKQNQDTWERKPGAFKNNGDFDNHDSGRGLEMLENADELQPEWDSVNVDDDMKMDMGSTVEDFENWKAHMRREELRKTGDTELMLTNSEQSAQTAKHSGNDVDNFFSFVKSKPVDTSQVLPGKGANGNHMSQSGATETGKSSRFSSFFTASQENSNDEHIGTKIIPGGPSPIVPEPVINLRGSKFFQGKGSPVIQNSEPSPKVPSRIANMQPVEIVPNVPHVPNIHNTQNSQYLNNVQTDLSNNNVQITHQFPTMMSEQNHTSSGLPDFNNHSNRPMNSESNSKDSFFMALLNKAESSNRSSSNSPSGSMPGEGKKVSGSKIFSKGTDTPPKTPVNTMSPADRDNPTSADKMPFKGHPNSQQLPPWMQQFPNNVPPPNMHPNYHFNPHMSGNMVPPPPPPGFMPPPGFIPPPGMSMRGPQNLGNNHGPMQFPNPQFMPYPPGLPNPELKQQNIAMSKKVYQQHQHPSQPQ